MIKYRADIDGLRGLAVVPVVLFHAQVSLFSGGYVGVDVFFVISGYLITTLLWGDIQQERFSILKFYERRARRILPALFSIILFSLAAGYFLLLPNDFHNLASSALSSVLFYSNVFFWREFASFLGALELQPLLHTWSLAVEEQFYIFFPILLWCIVKWKRSILVGAIALGGTGSFFLSVWASSIDPAGNFFLIPTRAWELAVGSLLALGVFGSPNQVQLLRGLAGVTGLGAICSAVFFYDIHTDFPGLAAALPVFGTAAIIWAGSASAATPSFVTRLLSLKPFVFVGLISYSLYLWHWPLLVFARHWFTQTQLSALATALIFALSFVLAILSWRFIERPFRRPNTLSSHAIGAFSIRA